MKRMLLFTLVTALIAVIGALILARIFTQPRSSVAIWTSAALATATQLATYGVARRYASRGDAMKGWGMGALIRVTALVFYGLVFFGPWSIGLPMEPALLSFALFVFASMLVEPLFLTR